MNLSTSSQSGHAINIVFLLSISLLLSLCVTAQTFEMPASNPTTKKEFINTKKDLIAAAKWLESTAIGHRDGEKGKGKYLGSRLAHQQPDYIYRGKRVGY